MSDIKENDYLQAAPASEPTRALAYRVRGRNEWHVCSPSEFQAVLSYGGVEYMELVNSTPGFINKVRCATCGSVESPVGALGASVACCSNPVRAAEKVPYDSNDEIPFIDVRKVALSFGDMTQEQQDKFLEQLKDQSDYHLSTIKSGDE